METYQGNSILWPFSRTTKEKTVEEETVMLIFSLKRLTKVRVCEIEMSLRYAKILLKCSLKSPFFFHFATVIGAFNAIHKVFL